MNYQITYELIKKWIKERKFFLCYQPIVETKSLQVKGFESLIRLMWDNRIVPPMEMSTWLDIPPFSATILHHVCHLLYEDLTRLNVSYQEDYFYSINCPATLFGTGMIPLFLDITKLSSLENQMMIEILEDHQTPSWVHEDLNNMKEFYQKHFVSLDDFQITRATLMKPLMYPVTHIKLHRAALKLPQELLNYAVQHWHELNYKIIAEHIETEADYNKICQANIDLFQGWYVAQPNALHSFKKLLRPTLPPCSGKVGKKKKKYRD